MTTFMQSDADLIRKAAALAKGCEGAVSLALLLAHVKGVSAESLAVQSRTSSASMEKRLKEAVARMGRDVAFRETFHRLNRHNRRSEPAAAEDTTSTTAAGD